MSYHLWGHINIGHMLVIWNSLNLTEFTIQMAMTQLNLCNTLPMMAKQFGLTGGYIQWFVNVDLML